MSDKFKPEDPLEKMVEEAKKTPKDAMKRAGKKKGGMTKDSNKKTHMMPSGKNMKGETHKDVKKASLGLLIGVGADKALKSSEGARSLVKNLGVSGQLLGKYYDKKADSKDKTTGQVTAKRMGGMVRGGRAEIKGLRPAKLT